MFDSPGVVPSSGPLRTGRWKMTDPSSPRDKLTQPHWLVDLATYSGVPSLTLHPEPGPEELRGAWDTICRRAAVDPPELARRVAAHFHLEVADLSAVSPPALKLIPADVARRLGVLPLRATDGEIVVASADPRNRRAQHELEAVSGRRVVWVVAPPGAILECVTRYYAPDQFLEHLVNHLMAEFRPDGLSLVREGTEAGLTDLDLEAPAVLKLTALVLDQLADAAVDEVHVEPERDGGHIRVRSGDELRHFMHLPLPALTRVVHRLKKLAGLDLDERVQPQKGQIAALVRGVNTELFVVTMPGINGEMMSILREEPDYEYFLEAMQQTLAIAREDPARGRVLVVDDDASARLLMRSVLEKEGFRVLEADDGPPALEVLDRYGDVSLVMLDLNMPDLNGREVLRRIRSSIGTAGLPVVVLTGVEDPAVEIELLEAGADDYLRKPIDPQRLAVRVRAVLRRAGSYDPFAGGEASES